MVEPNQSKKQRLDEAREAARLAREKRERRARTLKVLVPVLVSVGVLAIVGIVIAVVVLQPRPAGALPGGPANMASDGILFLQGDGGVQVAPTDALKKGQEPRATQWSSGDGVAHIVTYIDWSCPACQSFEGLYSAKIEKLVASGDATLEVHPIAILDDHFTGEKRYSTRAANVAACVAATAPDRYLDVQTEFYDKQATEGGDGLTTSAMVSLVHDAGVDDAKVDACIRGGSYEKWVTAATLRATGDEALANPATGSFTTPAVFVDGKRWTNGTDFMKFAASAS